MENILYLLSTCRPVLSRITTIPSRSIRCTRRMTIYSPYIAYQPHRKCTKNSRSSTTRRGQETRRGQWFFYSMEYSVPPMIGSSMGQRHRWPICLPMRATMFGWAMRGAIRIRGNTNIFIRIQQISGNSAGMRLASMIWPPCWTMRWR